MGKPILIVFKDYYNQGRFLMTGSKKKKKNTTPILKNTKKEDL